MSRFHKLGLIVSMYTELFVLTAMCLEEKGKKKICILVSPTSQQAATCHSFHLKPGLHLSWCQRSSRSCMGCNPLPSPRVSQGVPAPRGIRVQLAWEATGGSVGSPAPACMKFCWRDSVGQAASLSSNLDIIFPETHYTFFFSLLGQYIKRN